MLNKVKYNIKMFIDKFNSILKGVTTVNGNYCTAGIKK